MEFFSLSTLPVSISLVSTLPVSSSVFGLSTFLALLTFQQFQLKYPIVNRIFQISNQIAQVQILFPGPNSYFVIGSIGLAESFSYGALGLLNKVNMIQ